ncbi:MAG: phosphate ABC transporter ATP-binding protein [Bacillota bacterium]|nr:phosphate ABC transporter ATP-binding protein [Bacillota bacterium]
MSINNLTIQKGKIYGIIGPSGAGKSTLLRIINLLTMPDQGSILYKGSPLPSNGQDRLTIQRKMSMVFQKTLLFKDSVYNNVSYGLKARNYPHKEIHERVTTLLDQVGLQELARRRADTLSGGEAQRVAVARAIAFEPELLLLDEATANLDPINVELIEKLICKLNLSKSITVMMVTHNIFQAKRIANHVIFINQGKIIETGKTEDIFKTPKTEQTKAFVEGRMIY